MKIVRGATWTVRQGNLILGPYSLEELLAKLRTGEIHPTGAPGGEASSIDPDNSLQLRQLGDPEWFPISQVPLQGIQDAAAEGRVQFSHDRELELQEKAKRRANLRAGIVSGVVLLLVAAGITYLATRAKTHTESEQALLGALEITVDAPEIVKAKKSDEVLIAYPGRFSDKAQKRSATARRAGSAQATEPDGLQVAQVDTAGISAVVTANKPKLIPCIRAAVTSSTQPTKIPISFVVAATGKVDKLWVDNRDFKEDAALNACLIRELQKFPFAAGQSGATISLSFNVGARH